MKRNLARALRNWANRLEPVQQTTQVTLDGKAVWEALARYKRATGRGFSA